MVHSRVCLVAALAASLLFACSSDDDESSSTSDANGAADAPLLPADGMLRARIRRTAGGVPHVDADDLASAGFGASLAQAEDNICLIAEAVIKARGERALFFGPGEDDVNVVADFSQRAIAALDDAADAVASMSPQSLALLRGFVAGFNRHVADTAPAALPAACREAPWVRAIDVEDLYGHYRVLAQLASGGLFADGALLAAVPPGVSAEPGVTTSSALPTDRADRIGRIDPDDAARVGRNIRRAAAVRRNFVETGLASNVWAIGRELSETAGGALLANPHFPYSGPRRLYQFHLRVPGYIDVNGAGLIGTPIPQIAFNRDVAWSHTFSTSRRFTLYELTLADDDPLVYLKDGERRAIESRTFRVEVGGGAEPVVLEREVYYSEYGPMIAADLLTGGALPAWSDGETAFTYRDANASAATFLDTWIGFSRANGLGAFQRVIEDCGSSIWNNTAYTDAAGNAFYIDSSSVPNLSDGTLAALAARRAASPLARGLFDNGLTLLDGSTADEDWVEGDCGGIVPYADKPQLLRADFVQNSNASHWAANPAEPLTGFSPLYGEEMTELNPRTTLGLTMLQNPDEAGFASSAPAGQDGLFGARELLDVIWNGRALFAERVLPDLRARCAALGDRDVNVDGGTRDIAAGCDVLAAWDGTYSLDSVGAPLFRVFLATLFARDDVPFVVDFDPAEPAATTYAIDDAETRGSSDDVALQSLAAALGTLEDAGIVPNAMLGDVQTWQPSGGAPPGGEAMALADAIPWHGGAGGLDGAFNAVDIVLSDVAEDTRFPRLAPSVLPRSGGLSSVPGEGWAIGRGTSWHFGLAFTPAGPEAYGLTSYSQSSDARSPHFIDQSLAYSAKEPRRLLYDEADIAASVLPDGERVVEGVLSSP